MAGNNYPPGVTGNEPQIAGWPLCPKCGEEFVPEEGCEFCGFKVPEDYWLGPDPDEEREYRLELARLEEE